MGLSYKVNKTTHTQIANGNPEVNAAAVEQYLSSQSGPLSGIGGAEALGMSFTCAGQSTL